MNKLAVTVTHHPTEGHGLTFPFSTRMVAALKARVPSSERRYDARTKTWWLYRRSDLEALQSATNGWATFTKASKPALADFRDAQAVVQSGNAAARKRTFTCLHCGASITVRRYEWVHTATGDHWCGVDTFATPKSVR